MPTTAVLTRNPWIGFTFKRGNRDYLGWRCTTVNSDADLESAACHATAPTPIELDTGKNFLLVVNATAQTLDGGTATTDIFGGYLKTFALNDDGTTVTAGVLELANANSSEQHDAATGYVEWVASSQIPYPRLIAVIACSTPVSVNKTCAWEIYSSQEAR
jgi:hypothetical protein